MQTSTVVLVVVAVFAASVARAVEHLARAEAHQRRDHRAGAVAVSGRRQRPARPRSWCNGASGPCLGSWRCMRGLRPSFGVVGVVVCFCRAGIAGELGPGTAVPDRARGRSAVGLRTGTQSRAAATCGLTYVRSLVVDGSGRRFDLGGAHRRGNSGGRWAHDVGLPTVQRRRSGYDDRGRGNRRLPARRVDMDTTGTCRRTRRRRGGPAHLEGAAPSFRTRCRHRARSRGRRQVLRRRVRRAATPTRQGHRPLRRPESGPSVAVGRAPHRDQLGRLHRGASTRPSARATGHRARGRVRVCHRDDRIDGTTRSNNVSGPTALGGCAVGQPGNVHPAVARHRRGERGRLPTIATTRLGRRVRARLCRVRRIPRSSTR